MDFNAMVDGKNVSDEDMISFIIDELQMLQDLILEDGNWKFWTSQFSTYRLKDMSLFEDDDSECVNFILSDIDREISKYYTIREMLGNERTV